MILRFGVREENKNWSLASWGLFSQHGDPAASLDLWRF